MQADADEYLDIHLQPSRTLSWIAVATYALIAVSLCFANLPWWALGGLWLALYLQAVMQWRRIRTPLPPFELTRLRWQNNHWLLTLSNSYHHNMLYRNALTLYRNTNKVNTGEEVPWQLIWLRIIPYFIFLRLQPASGKPRSLIIAKDQLIEKDYRQLLLWLQMRPWNVSD